MKNAIIKPRTLSGFRDRLPHEALVKKTILQTVSDVFESYGFAPIETPHLEYAEILVKQGSDEIQKELYRFKDHGERDVALRFDQTVPLARFVTQHKTALGMPFKRYAIGNVFRGERAQAGRYREFTQCDFDFIGTDSVCADAEIVQVIADSLLALGINDFTIALNNRKVMNGYCAWLGLSGQTEGILRIVDKLDKTGEDKVRTELIEQLGISAQQADSILAFTKLKQESGASEFFSGLFAYRGLDPQLDKGLEELQHLTELLDALSIPDSTYKIDFSIARGLGYYTGIVYETTLDSYPKIGSVCSGGRYDNLTATFSNEAMPGVGASIGIDRLIAALEELSLLDQKSTPAQVMVLQLDAKYEKHVYKTAEKLRKAGIYTEIYPKCDKLKKQMNYANNKKHPFVIFMGEDEITNDSLTLKEMETGLQYDKIGLEEAIAKITTIDV